MQPYLESLPNYIDGAPLWTPTNRGHGITSRPLKHDHELSPRGSWVYVLTTYQSYLINQVIFITHINLIPYHFNHSSSIFHVESIITHPSQSMNIELYLMLIPCQESSFLIHESFHIPYQIHTQLIIFNL